MDNSVAGCTGGLLHIERKNQATIQEDGGCYINVYQY